MLPTDCDINKEVKIKMHKFKSDRLVGNIIVFVEFINSIYFRKESIG